jgi:glyoxylate utilization-related uncharacterized protein
LEKTFSAFAQYWGDFLRGSIVHFFLFFFLRILRRQAGTISFSDLLVVVLIAAAAQNALASQYQSITEGLILVTTIVFWNFLLDWLDYRAVPLNRALVAQSWSRRGYSCDLFIDPGPEWNDFVHSTIELVTVVEGKLRMTIEEEALIAEPGDEVFIPKDACHSVKIIHSATTKWLYGYD